MKKMGKKKFLWRLFFSVLCLALLLSGFFYLQKVKVRVSNPRSPEEVIKTYFRAVSYGEYEKAISLYTEHYKRQTQDYEIKRAALYNKRPLTIAERMKRERPFWTLLLAPSVDLVPCNFSEYQADSDPDQIKGFRVKCCGARQYFVVLKKDQTGKWRMDGPPGTGP